MWISIQNVVNIVSFDQNKNMNMLNMENSQSLNMMTKRTFGRMKFNFGIFSSKDIEIFVLVN